MKVTLEVSEPVYGLLQTIADANGGSVEAVLQDLIDHAQQGIYRPGSWERSWLIQAVGERFTEFLEPGDPYGRRLGESIFQRPKRKP